MSARRFVTLTSYAAQRLTHTPSVLQESSAALHRNATLAVPEKISAYTIMHTHAYTYVHALVHACMRTHAHIHACMYRCTTSEPSPSPRRTSSSYAWSTRRVAHSPPCSVRGALPPACMYARVWMLSAWSAAPCMCVRMHMDAQCVAYTAHADRHRKDHRRLPVEVVSTWVAQIASAVSYMHSLRMLHRDLSTHNVFFTASGRVKVGDFGLTKVGGRMRAISARAYPRPRPRPHPTPQPHLQPSVPPP